MTSVDASLESREVLSYAGRMLLYDGPKYLDVTWLPDCGGRFTYSFTKGRPAVDIFLKLVESHRTVHDYWEGPDLYRILGTNPTVTFKHVCQKLCPPIECVDQVRPVLYRIHPDVEVIWKSEPEPIPLVYAGTKFANHVHAYVRGKTMAVVSATYTPENGWVGKPIGFWYRDAVKTISNLFEEAMTAINEKYPHG
jgi:hypothetical protein